MNIEDIWSGVLDLLKKEFSPISFSTWFGETQLYKITDDTIILQVPLSVHKKMFLSNYYDLISNAFMEVTGKVRDLECLLTSEIEELEAKTPLEKEIEKVIVNNNFESNLNKDLNFDNFVVGDTNKFARTAAFAVAQDPGNQYNPLFIYGKSGLGKTHLMHAIGNYIVENSDKKVLYATCEDFMTDYTGIADLSRNANSLEYANEFKNKYRNIDVLIIDDIQYLVGADKTQQEFFNTFNALHKAGKQIIISSDKSPDDLKKIEERLRSRFMWGLPVDIYPPDFDLRCRIIRNKIANTSIADKIDEKVIEYIANSCQNDVRHIEGTINRLMAYTAMIVPDKIDLEFAYEALKDFITTNIYSASSIEKIQKAVASYYGITIDDLKGKKRSNKVAYPRQLGMYLCRMETNETFPKIGLEFGGRDHSTVIFACEKIEKELKENNNLQVAINEIKNRM